MPIDLEKEKLLAANEAVKYIRNNQVVGLGTGSTAIYAIKAIGEMVRNGLIIQAVPTSNSTRELAASLNIPLIDVNSVHSIDITIDGWFYESATGIKTRGWGSIAKRKNSCFYDEGRNNNCGFF